MQWRGKLLCALILYAAGFATAIYVLVPSSVQASNSQTCGIDGPQESALQAGIDTQAWAGSIRLGMNKAISFAEENALLIAEKIKAQIQQSKAESGK